MRTVILHLPETFELDEREIVMTLAAKLYEDGKLSIGQAAELVGLTKRAFMEIIGKYGVSIFNYPSSEIANDVQNA